MSIKVNVFPDNCSTEESFHLGKSWVCKKASPGAGVNES